MKKLLVLCCLMIPLFIHGLISQTWTPLPDPGHGGQHKRMVVNQENGTVSILALKPTPVVNQYVLVTSQWDGSEWVTSPPTDSTFNVNGGSMMVGLGDSLLIPDIGGMHLFHNQQWSYRSFSGPAACVPFYFTAVGTYNGHLYASGVFYEKRPDSTWNKTNPVFLAYLDDTIWVPLPRFKGAIYKIESIDNKLYLGGEYRDSITNTQAGLGYLDGQQFYLIDSTISCIDFVKGGDDFFIKSIHSNGITMYHWTTSGITELTHIKQLTGATYAIAWFDEKLIIAGCFDDTAAGGQRFKHIAAMDAAGKLYLMNIGFNGLVSDLGQWNNSLFAAGNYTLADNNPAFGIASWTGSITGIGEIVHQNHLKPYPNPARGIIHIPFDGSDGSIEVFTLTGTRVFRQDVAGLAGTHRQLDLSSLNPGMYLVVANSTGKSKSWKVVLTD